MSALSNTVSAPSDITVLRARVETIGSTYGTAQDVGTGNIIQFNRINCRKLQAVDGRLELTNEAARATPRTGRWILVRVASAPFRVSGETRVLGGYWGELPDRT
jgi:hypothetical protein